MAKSFSCNTFFGGEGGKGSRFYPFYPFYRGGKIAIQTGPALFWLQEKDCSTTSPVRLARLYFTSTTRLHLGRLKQYPKDKRPEYNERSANLICNLVNNRIILSSRYRRYCGSFLWKWINEKYSLFGYIGVFLLTKNPNHPDFLICDVHFVDSLKIGFYRLHFHFYLFSILKSALKMLMLN